jgi:hypothetical protein
VIAKDKLEASPQMECWNHSMRLTKAMSAKSTVIPINCRISDTFTNSAFHLVGRLTLKKED